LKRDQKRQKHWCLSRYFLSENQHRNLVDNFWLRRRLQHCHLLHMLLRLLQHLRCGKVQLL